ncbi:nuclease-related domain-containing DEAD/DEAH box helicase [Frondihabitans cladoniiphilus]|uniref:DNA 3'-5' helicase n=1 Tax=Frondihabitans cladoniiphilus TaxID=715785 RepID=A0ABP8W9K9_9MICO
MTIAGGSAAREQARQLALVEQLDRQSYDARQRAARFGLASITERRVVDRLAPLASHGFHLLADRGWPGSKTAQVDLVVVGESGVFIVDTKAWADVSVQGGRLFHGQADAADDLDRLADLAWKTEDVLAELGLAPGEVHAVAVLAGRSGFAHRVDSVDVVGEHDVLRHLTRRGHRLTPTQVNRLLLRLADYFPVLDESTTPQARGMHDPTLLEPVLPREPGFDPSTAPGFGADAAHGPADGRAETAEPEATLEADVDQALLEALLAAPIEEWMAFLDPAQAKLVRRSFNGPARIRGAAGTGKTVVGLHRAAYLAHQLSRPRRILFTTYVKTLPPVLATLLARLAPEVADRVEFVHVHGFAVDLLRQRGIPHRIDPMGATAAFDDAWSRLEGSGPLTKGGLTRSYWHEEITKVIKGRGITTFDAYADLARVGRRHRVTIDQRQAVWDLFVAYTEGLRRRGITDFEDIVLLARDSLRASPVTDYDAVLIDEAQDLSAAMVDLLHGLVGDRPDGLTLIGDGQQTIYPGGYTLGELGISLAGRGVVMTVNHRNTAEILDFANAVVDGDEFGDIEGGASGRDAVATVSRTGPTPELRTFSSNSAHDEALLERLREILRNGDARLGDIAILAATTWQLAATVALLQRAEVPYLDLAGYDGTPVAAVKVGTIKRSKGLEFKQVLVSRLDRQTLRRPNPEVLSPSDLEKLELSRRELYVAMTRARDGLWVGVR